jgi:hypothetical protein
MLTQLSKIRLDKKEIHIVRDISLRRDALTIGLNRGVIAFLEPVNGKVTGAVFIGSGEIVTIPADPVEKQQIYKFTGTPILNEPFGTAILRFTDQTFDEIKKEISQHAQEEVSADEAAQFDVWSAALGSRSAYLNLRIASDFLEPSRPVFLAELNGEKRGWFTVEFDQRATEEVSILQVHEVRSAVLVDIWASFNQRNEVRNPEAVAHEDKSPVQIVSYQIDGTATGNVIDAKATLRAKARFEGARVLNFELSPALRVSSVATELDEAVPFYQFPDSSTVAIVLPRPVKAGQDVTLKFAYAGDASTGAPYPTQRQQTIPSLQTTLLALSRVEPVVEYLGRKLMAASYHDQWLIDGLARYPVVTSGEADDTAGTSLHKLLADARVELNPNEGAGPIWLGQRLMSMPTPTGARAVSAKAVWVLHMLRMMLRTAGPDPDAKFKAMLEEFATTYDGRAVSTWDFEHVAEKYAGKKLDWFFDEWVFATGLPSYAVDYKTVAAGNEFTVEGTITQAGVPEGFQMPVPVYADDQYLGTVSVGESEGQFKFRVAKKPEQILLDPEMTILTSTAAK